jgi:hypothetical protein
MKAHHDLRGMHPLYWNCDSTAKAKAHTTESQILGHGKHLEVDVLAAKRKIS